MILETVDWSVIILIFVASLTIGIVITRQTASNSICYFLYGKLNMGLLSTAFTVISAISLGKASRKLKFESES